MNTRHFKLVTIRASSLVLLAGLIYAAPTLGAAIFIGGDESGIVDVFTMTGQKLFSFDAAFTIDDGLAVGDLDGNGDDEVLIAGDETFIVDIFDVDIFNKTATKLPSSLNNAFTIDDGFAVGDVDDGFVGAEIIIAGDQTGIVDVFKSDGQKIHSFNGDFTEDDALAIGDVDGDGVEEILVAGDENGIVDIFTMTGQPLFSFDAAFTIDDGFAIGDVDGDGVEEILVAGDESGIVDIFDVDISNNTATKLPSFNSAFTIDDGFAVGDVDGFVGAEIIIAGDQTGIVDVFKSDGQKIPSFDGDFTEDDGFAVRTGPYPDQDGDGLLDRWEQFGLDADNNGTIDVDLPGFGADPLHKDLFLELDWVPGQTPTSADIAAMKEAFAAAPIDAGGTPNPDGQPGINLWVDAGALIDGIGPVGDNLGGGNNILPPLACELDAAFYAAKAANFNPNRRLVFRYAISAAGCDADADGNNDSGGEGELGGNDFIDFNHDGGTIMHELGHNLNLRHGGNVDANCKPNYVSVMNYDYPFGINQNGGTVIFDYSPPRIAADGSTRGVAPLPLLNEQQLNEASILDGTDGLNRFVFSSNGQKIQWPLDGQSVIGTGVDWNNDNVIGGTVPINVDTVGANGVPADCANTSLNVLSGHDDWSVISLPFWQFGDAADSAINPVLDPEPTTAELQLLQRELNTADLEVSKSDSPDPVKAGEQLTYTLAVTNHGPNPSSHVTVTDSLPAQVSFVSASAGCAAAGGSVTCELGEVLAHATEQATIVVLVDPNIPVPNTITNAARVQNLAGPDPVPGNNSDTELTRVIAGQLSCHDVPATIQGTAASNVLVGTAGDDVIHGGDDDDQISGGGGNDIICGGAGNDRLDGGRGNDLLDGGASTDSLRGGAGTDDLWGGPGDDLLDGGPALDDNGNYTVAPGPVTANLTAGTATGEGTDRLVNLERLLGGAFDDTLIGNSAANVLFGNGGDDKLDGRAGNDSLDGGLGSDIGDGGAGTDTCTAETEVGCEL